MDATLLAHSPLPLEGQVALLHTGLHEYVNALSASVFFEPSVAQMLYDFARNDEISTSPSVVWRAIRTLDDIKTLDEILVSGFPSRAASAARNPKADPASIVEGLSRGNDDVALSALINPTTPQAIRREIATPDLLARTAKVGPSLGHTVVRAAEIVLNNPFLADSPESLDPVFHRAIVCSPFSSPEEVKAANGCSRTGRKFTKRHPLLVNTSSSWDVFSTKELLVFAHPASDVVALAREDLTVADAASMLGRREPLELEPQVLARLLRRFGFEPLTLLETPPMYAGSRTSSAAWSHPSAAVLDGWTTDSADQFREILESLPLLGSDPSVWSTVVSLLGKWDLGFKKLAQASLKLYR